MSSLEGLVNIYGIKAKSKNHISKKADILMDIKRARIAQGSSEKWLYIDEPRAKVASKEAKEWCREKHISSCPIHPRDGDPETWEGELEAELSKLASYTSDHQTRGAAPSDRNERGQATVSKAKGRRSSGCRRRRSTRRRIGQSPSTPAPRRAHRRARRARDRQAV